MVSAARNYDDCNKCFLGFPLALNRLWQLTQRVERKYTKDGAKNKQRGSESRLLSVCVMHCLLSAGFDYGYISFLLTAKCKCEILLINYVFICFGPFLMVEYVY